MYLAPGTAPVARIPLLRPPPITTAALRFSHKRQEFIEGILLQQRVAPGKQEAIKITLLQRLVAHLPFINAEANGLDHALLAHFQQRLVGPSHRLLEVNRLLRCAMSEHVTIVNECNINPLNGHALQCIFERAHRAVVGIIKVEGEWCRIDPWREVDACAWSGRQEPADFG